MQEFHTDTFTDPLSNCSFSSNGHFIQGSALRDKDGNKIRELKVAPGKSIFPPLCALSWEGQRIAFVKESNRVEVWNTMTDDLAAHWTAQSPITAPYFAPEGWLLVGDRVGSSEMWDVAKGKQLQQYIAH